MSFNTKLINLLKTDPRFLDDEGELVFAAIHDAAWKTDRALVKSLISDSDIKAVFFEEIERHWIFNVNKFINYIAQKNFLDNSYTRFRNRIGLTIGGKYLGERGEVALVWPYKDCVLEGGQTKEEEKRKEIFFNEVLAQDEINRLLDPKVLTNFVRYTAKGKEKVTDFKRAENGVIRENLIIKGNNLLALHSLKGQFRGRVKLIYIDPPYNTGNDSFGYNDSFNHSTWLTFMKNRLEIAQSLLRNDGVIFIQCDDSEYAYLKILSDEVFGQENYLVTFYIQVRYEEKTLSERMDFQKLIEQILVYKKNTFKPNKPTKTYAIDNFEWQIIEIGRGKKITLGNRDAILFKPGEYEIRKVEPSTRALKETWASGTVLKANASGKFFNDFIAPRIITDGLGCLYKVFGIGEDGLGYRYFTGPKREGATKGKFYSGVPLIRLEQLQNGNAIKEMVIPNFMNLADSFGNCRQEGGVELRSGKKPEELLKSILEMSSSEGDIVLDFFTGTGTTAAVAHKMGRQYIGIEQLDYGENDSVVRLQNVIKGDQSGISKASKWQGGGDFIYCELMKYNEAFMERIQAAQSSEELLNIWREMAEGSFLNWYVNPTMPEEAVNDFMALGREENGLGKQKQILAELLDKNQLYVNLSEIDDAQFKVSEEDKALNKAFYGEAYNA
jgi:adenine-specific DNA-methyltransferase